MNELNKSILNQLSNMLYDLGTEWGFSRPIVHSSGLVSKVYIIRNHAIQLEIDWFEYDLFMYVVCLKNSKLPDANVVYHYKDGQWCRKYLEEIYQTKRPAIKDKSRRYSTDYLYDRFDFYAQMIRNRPSVLEDFFRNQGMVL